MEIKGTHDFNFCKDLYVFKKKKNQSIFGQNIGDVEILSLIKIFTVHRWKTNSGHAMGPD